MNAEARRAWQTERLRATLAAARQPAQGDPWAALARLPILRKEALIDRQAANPPFGGLLGVPVAALQRLFMSPGPIYDPQGTGPDYWRWGDALRAAGFVKGDIALITFAFHLTPAGHMFDEAARALGCVVVPGGGGNSELQARLLRDAHVTAYVGVASFLLVLLEKARELGFGAQVQLRCGFVTAEPLAPSVRRRLQDEFGVTTRQGYGTADLGCVAYECERADGLHLDDHALVELVEGEVVVTLLSDVYPLLRFGTGDLAAWADGACPCGRTSPRLAGILGRVGEAVKVRGMFVHPRQIAEALEPGARFQAVVTRPGHTDEFTVRIEQPAAPADQLRQRLQDLLKLRVEVELIPPGTLPADAPRIRDERTWE